MTDSPIAYQEDQEYARLLVSGESAAWDRFYNEFRRKLESYVNRKYPNIFSEIAVEEIFDGIGKRLMENNYKAVREYRGECSFSAYITKATEWEIRDWLRNYSITRSRKLLCCTVKAFGYALHRKDEDSGSGSFHSSKEVTMRCIMSAEIGKCKEHFGTV